MSEHVLKYRGLQGSVEVSLEDNVLHGKILHIVDLVTFEAQTPEGLRQAFKQQVDEYLAFCEEEGVAPDKPFSYDEEDEHLSDLERQKATVINGRYEMSNENENNRITGGQDTALVRLVDEAERHAPAIMEVRHRLKGILTKLVWLNEDTTAEVWPVPSSLLERLDHAHNMTNSAISKLEKKISTLEALL